MTGRRRIGGRRDADTARARPRRLPVAPLPDLVARLDALRLALTEALPQPALAGIGARLPETAPPDAAPGADGRAAPSVVPDDMAPELRATLERAQRGDAAAFGDLYDRYVDLVYRYVYLRVGNAALAEDLTSETFVRGLRRITTFRWQGRDVGAWFVTIARNLVADHFKSARYRLEVSTADLLEAGADRAEDGPERAVLEALAGTELLTAVRRLRPEQQECIALRFLEGLSITETAQVMGKNEGSVKALQYRALRALGRLVPPGLLR